MHFAIDLPDELTQKLQQHGNVLQFIKEAIQLKLESEEKIKQKQLLQKQELLTLIHTIEPVTSPCSSVKMLEKIRQHNQ